MSEIIKIGRRKYLTTGFFADCGQPLVMDKEGYIYRKLSTRNELATGCISNNYAWVSKRVKWPK